MSQEHRARPLTRLERMILDRLLERAFRGSDEIRQQIEHASAELMETGDNYGSVLLFTTSDLKAATSVTVPVEGVTSDTDGNEIVVMLHVHDGVVNELEILKSDGSDMIGVIDPSAIKVTILQPKEVMMAQPFREINDYERSILERMLTFTFAGREEVRGQLASAMARNLDSGDNYGSIEFEIPTDKETANVTQRVPIELESKDSDGVPIAALLHVIAGIVDELEIIKADGTPIADFPASNDFGLPARARPNAWLLPE